MKNPLTRFREAVGLTKAELARRSGVSRQQITRLEKNQRKLSKKWAEILAPVLRRDPTELMFPETAHIDVRKFSGVPVILDEEGGISDEPGIAFDPQVLSRLLPSAKGHRLRLMIVETDPPGNLVAKGDAVMIDLDANRPTVAGLYALRIAGVIQFRYLSIATTGQVQVHEGPNNGVTETVKAETLDVVGRARLRISTI